MLCNFLRWLLLISGPLTFSPSHEVVRRSRSVSVESIKSPINHIEVHLNSTLVFNVDGTLSSRVLGPVEVEINLLASPFYAWLMFVVVSACFSFSVPYGRLSTIPLNDVNHGSRLILNWREKLDLLPQTSPLNIGACYERIMKQKPIKCWRPCNGSHSALKPSN